MHYQASHDALTGLINRREFENRLTAAVENVRKDRRVRVTCCCISISINSKLVNDTCGHPAGDQLLKQITGVLQVARARRRHPCTPRRRRIRHLAADCSLDQALRVAEQLRQAIRDFRFMWQQGVLAVGCEHRHRGGDP